MKNNKGFSLVELIVVIAIMAILAAVAVAGFSFYIPKAQQASDKQMISDIEYILTLASYNGTFAEGDSGYIVLTTNGIANDIEPNSALDVVLKNAYGAEYKKTMKLAYDQWGNNGLAMGLTKGQAQNVYKSTYYQSSDKLMSQVTDITNAAWNLLSVGMEGDEKPTRDQMIGMFADGSMTLEDAALAYGYDSLDDVPDEALPNLMVLAIAGDVTMENNDTEDTHNMSAASGLIQGFALYNGYAATTSGKTAPEGESSFADAYNTFVAKLDQAQKVSDVTAAYKELQAIAAEDAGYQAYLSSQQSATDLNAFTAMMSGLTGAANNNQEGVVEGLTQADFFTNGLGNSLFNTYIDSVESALYLSDDASNALFDAINQEDGSVVIFYSVVNNEVKLGNTLPN